MAPTLRILWKYPDTKLDSELSTMYYYAIYRVAIDIKVSFCIFVLRKTCSISSRSRLLYMRVRDKRNQLCQLPRSGWSVGRAGLRAKATYPA